jgi:type II secretory ATPase GspE/PulE/Tfp pilus assembly ATPase PilB-like protein
MKKSIIASNQLTWLGEGQETLTVPEFLSNIDGEAHKLLTVEVARRNRVLPLKVLQTRPFRKVQLACCSDLTFNVVQSLEFALDAKLEFIKVSPDILTRIIERAYQPADVQLKSALVAFESEDSSDENGVVSSFVDGLLRYACERDASDIHILPTQAGTSISLRVDGQLLSHSNPIATSGMHKKLVRRIKVLAKIDLNRDDLPSDGEFSYENGLFRYAIRLATMPSYWGERLTLRLHSRDRQAAALDSLGFDQAALLLFERFCRGHPRLGFVVGPTGAGKTTTLYGLLQLVRDLGRQVITIEDPVELPIAGLSQSALNLTAGASYPVMLRAALRHDPDAIMVGEVRDAETAKSAFSASMTGHHVFSSLHGGSIAEGLQRLLELGIDPRLLENCVGLLVFQKLESKMCVACKRFDGRGWIAEGCIRCSGTGIVGRQLRYEVAYGLGSGRHKILRLGAEWICAKEYVSSS